jgi:hypothetical protein
MVVVTVAGLETDIKGTGWSGLADLGSTDQARKEVHTAVDVAPKSESGLFQDRTPPDARTSRVRSLPGSRAEAAGKIAPRRPDSSSEGTAPRQWTDDSHRRLLDEMHFCGPDQEG